MIHTFLDPTPEDAKAEGDPITQARPKVLSLVRIPRFHPPLAKWQWNADHLVNFLVDTGADSTTIDLADAIALFPPKRFAEIGIVQEAYGIGQQTVKYAVEPAELYLLHDDGMATPIYLNLGIQRPPDYMIKRNSVSNSLLASGQALLGRDVLAQFKFDLDYMNPTPYLRLWPKSTELIDLRRL